MRQTPTTLTNDFGSAPTVSPEKSIFRDCAASAQVSSAARPAVAMAIVVVRLVVFILEPPFLILMCSDGAGDRSQHPARMISSGRPAQNKGERLCIAARTLPMCIPVTARTRLESSLSQLYCVKNQNKNELV